jgi:hypothetical protein
MCEAYHSARAERTRVVPPQRSFCLCARQPAVLRKLALYDNSRPRRADLKTHFAHSHRHKARALSLFLCHRKRGVNLLKLVGSQSRLKLRQILERQTSTHL